jgi:uncharacterized protein
MYAPLAKPVTVWRESATQAAACLLTEARLANNPLSRLMGLLGSSVLEDTQGLWIEPCQSIHMFWMQQPLDAVFIDKQGMILKILESIQPWQISPLVKGARVVLELKAGQARILELEEHQDRLWLVDTSINP